MRNVDRWFVLTGLGYGFAGMLFGIWMGISHSLNFGNSHAHFNLVGFVLLTLTGLLHRAWPALREGRAAAAQFWLMQAAVALFVTGKIVVDATGNSGLVAAASLLVVAAVLMLLVRFARLADHHTP